MTPKPGLHGVIEFVSNLALIHEMLKGMMNLSLTTAGAVWQESACEKLIKRTVWVNGTLNEKSGEKERQDVRSIRQH